MLQSGLDLFVRANEILKFFFGWLTFLYQNQIKMDMETVDKTIMPHKNKSSKQRNFVLSFYPYLYYK